MFLCQSICVMEFVGPLLCLGQDRPGRARDIVLLRMCSVVYVLTGGSKLVQLVYY